MECYSVQKKKGRKKEIQILVIKTSCEVTRLCPTLCDPMDRFLCPRDFPGKNTGVGCHFLLQGIFMTQGSNLGLPQRR